MKPAPFAYQRAHSLSDALTVLSESEDFAPIAGGQSLLVLLGLRMSAFERVIDVTRLSELRATQQSGDTVFLGAAVTHAEIEDGLVPDPSLGLMPRIASGIGYRAIRNRGTLGGSLALSDPSADWPPCLVALDATIVLASSKGERRVPAKGFHVGPYETGLEPGELIVGAEIPRLPSGATWGCAKHSRKSGAFADSIAIVVKSGAGVASVVLGATSSHPQLLPSTSAACASDALGDEHELRRLVADEVAQIDPDADAWRRRCHVATVLSAIREATR